MEGIIQEIVAKFIKNFYERLDNGELSDVDGMAKALLEDCKEMSSKLLKAALEELNLSIRQDKEMRREAGLYMQQHNRPRGLLTMIGMVNYSRDSYKEKDSGKYVYPVDELTGVASYERVGAHVCAELVNAAAQVSYQKATQIAANGSVSRQTVKNKVSEVGVLEKPAPKEKSKAEEVHIFVDEDHVHMQPKRSKIVPYAVLSEGVEEVCNSRRRTVNPTHFANRDLDGKAMWEQIAGYLHMSYPEGCKVYIHGDGAAWIKSGADIIPESALVLDGFHLQKYLLKLNRLCPGRNIRKRVIDAIEANDKGRAEEIMDKAIAQIEAKQAEKALKAKGYILNNWTGIQNRYKEGMPGSSSEGQISHGLSERLSRDPAAWSEEGLGSMAMLRAYVNNGLKVEAKDFRRADKEKKTSVLSEYAERLYSDAIAGAKDWSIFERIDYTMDTASATQKLIGMYGNMHSPIS